MKGNPVVMLLLGLVPILAAADGGASPGEAPDRPSVFRAAGPLEASQLQAIQNVSRSVLTAKRGYQPDADQTALRDELQGLATAIDNALAPQAGSKVRLLEATGATSAEEASANEGDRYRDLRAHLDTMHAHRQRIEKHARRVVSDSSRPQTANLAAKVAELEAETDAALNAQGAERIGRLRALRTRLRPKNLRETMEERFETPAGEAAKAAPGKEAIVPSRNTPTISTLVHHR